MPTPSLDRDECALLADLVERAANAQDPSGPWGVYVEPPTHCARASDRATPYDWLVMLRPLGADPRSLTYASPRLYEALHTAWRALGRSSADDA